MIDLIAGVAGSIVPDIINGMTGGVSGAAVNALKDIGIDIPKGSDPVKELRKIIADASPEDLLNLRKANDSFKETMAKIDLDLSKLNVDNTKDARAMHMEMKSNFVPVLAFTIVIASLTMVLALFFVTLPQENESLINLFLGIVIGLTSHIVGFYFGASNNQKGKV